MGKPSGSNSEAIKLQRESMAQSKLASDQMNAMLERQIEQQRQLKLPSLPKPQPLPTTSSADAIAQQREVANQLRQRNGLDDTKLVSAKRPMLRSMMGAPIFNPQMAA